MSIHFARHILHQTRAPMVDFLFFGGMQMIACLHWGENGELRVGVRRLMRQQNNMPSSVISCDSMHLGVLATASQAISTGTLFSVFYKPSNFTSEDLVILLKLLFPSIHVMEL
ncbi:hypothetical protein U1Q18_037677 [Sarracenia purpurea var. burkii]